MPRTPFPIMHQWSLSELQGVSTQRGASTQRTAQKQVTIPGSTSPTSPSRWGSRPRRGSGCWLCPQRGALLWAWLLLAALVVPGAWSSLSEEEEELIVELHNHYRGQVSPSASAMLPLVRHHTAEPVVYVLQKSYFTLTFQGRISFSD